MSRFLCVHRAYKNFRTWILVVGTCDYLASEPVFWQATVFRIVICSFIAIYPIHSATVEMLDLQVSGNLFWQTFHFELATAQHSTASDLTSIKYPIPCRLMIREACLFIGALGRVDGKGHFAPITVIREASECQRPQFVDAITMEGLDMCGGGQMQKLFPDLILL